MLKDHKCGAWKRNYSRFHTFCKLRMKKINFIVKGFVQHRKWEKFVHPGGFGCIFEDILIKLDSEDDLKGFPHKDWKQDGPSWWEEGVFCHQVLASKIYSGSTNRQLAVVSSSFSLNSQLRRKYAHLPKCFNAVRQAYQSQAKFNFKRSRQLKLCLISLLGRSSAVH